MSGLAKGLLIFALISGSATGTAFAADSSTPGQMLYPVDQAMEQVQQALALTPNAQARLCVRLVEERAEELGRMAEKGNTPTEGDIIRLQSQIQTALQNAAQLSEPQMIQMLSQFQMMAQQQAGQMLQLGLNDEAEMMRQASTRAQRGVDDPAGFQSEFRAGPGGSGQDGSQGPGQDGSPGESGGQNQGQQGDQQQSQECDPASGADCGPIQEQDQNQDGSGDGGSQSNNDDPSDADPGNDDPGSGQSGEPGVQDTPGPHGQNDEPGDADPGSDSDGNGTATPGPHSGKDSSRGYGGNSSSGMKRP